MSSSPKRAWPGRERYVVRGGDPEAVEGEPADRGVAILEFEGREVTVLLLSDPEV